MTSPEEHGAFSTTTTGATVRTLYVQREVKVFAVHEFEYNSLSNLSDVATIAFAVAGVTSAYAIGIWTDAAFAEKLTPAGELAEKFVAPALLIAAVVAAIIGLVALCGRSALWGSIKKQSSSS
jgi:hypothetical protein